MTSTIVRRLLAVVPTLVVATVVVFALVQITPGGAAEAAAGPTATPQQVHALALQMGLDKPLPVQYATWLWNLAHGDFGQSLINRQSISQEIGRGAAFASVSDGETGGLCGGGGGISDGGYAG